MDGVVDDEELLREAVTAPEQFANKWNELLSRFYRGLPGERLRELLTHTNERVVQGGLFIADEIYDRAHPVLPEIIALATHPNANVRLSAYYAIHSCACKGKEAVFIHALRGLLDSDVLCRIGAMVIAAQTKSDILGAVLPQLGEADIGLRDGVTGLLGDASEQGSLIMRWGRMEPVYRRFAAIAAARDQSHWLMLAWLIDTCDDADIRDFAVQFTRPRVAMLVKQQGIVERAARKAKSRSEHSVEGTAPAKGSADGR